MPEFVAVTRLHSASAAVVAGALEAEGLTVQLYRDGFGVVYGLEAGLFATEVRVPTDQVDRARALLAEVEDTAPD